MDEDFFGIQYISQQPIPPHILPKTTPVPVSDNLNDPKLNNGAELDFISATFFPQLTNEHTVASDSIERNEKRKKNKSDPNVDPDDYFSEIILKNKEESRFFDGDAVQLSDVKNVEKYFANNPELMPKDGLKTIFQLIHHVSKYNHEELVQLMEKRVIYDTNDVIAFDKPYQLAQGDLKKILMDLKKRLAPSTDRFYLVSPLEKFCSGVLVFAKSKEKKEMLKKMIADNLALYRYRILVKNAPKQPRTRVNIPLIKVESNGDHKLCPLTGRAVGGQQIFHETTDVQLVNENPMVHMCLLNALTKRSQANVVRSHLYYGLNCPVLGDRKYMKHEKEFRSTFDQLPRVSTAAMDALRLGKIGDVRQLPMFIHLAEVHLPETTNGRYSIVRAEIPEFFRYALRRLKLIKK